MSDDTIYRRAAIDAVRHSPIIEVQPAYMLIDKADVLKNLILVPSAQSERKTGKTLAEEVERIKREITDIFAEQMGVQPSVQLGRKGKWVDGWLSRFDGTKHWFRECSECGYERDDDNPEKDTNYCPNCGAEMQKVDL